MISRARRRRSRLRRASSYQTATFEGECRRLGVTPWVRPAISVSLCLTARAPRPCRSLSCPAIRRSIACGMKGQRGVPDVVRSDGDVDEA